MFFYGEDKNDAKPAFDILTSFVEEHSYFHKIGPVYRSFDSFMDLHG